MALKAGVSQATVSKVVNNYPSVSPTNVKRVRQAMDDLGYQPIPRKTRSKPNSINTVAILVFPGAVFQEYRSSLVKMMSSIQASLRSNGMDMLIAHVTDVQSLPHLVRTRQVSGLILQGGCPDKQVLKYLDGIPSVWVSSHVDSDASILLEGNEAIGQLAADYLIARGHKRLGVINAISGNPVLDKRCEHFRFVIERSNLTCQAFVTSDPCKSPRIDQLNIPNLEESVDHCVKKLLDSDEKPSGIFVPFDLQLAAVYRALLKRNIQIVGNFDFVGSDEESPALLGLYPRPATINIGPDTIGSRAVQELCFLIKNGTDDANQIRITVVPSLIPGD